MRITIDYLPDEAEGASLSVEALQEINPGIKVRPGKDGATFKHIYLTTRNHGKLRGARESGT